MEKLTSHWSQRESAGEGKQQFTRPTEGRQNMKNMIGKKKKRREKERRKRHKNIGHYKEMK
jgi:hypothetical protein